MQLCIVGLTNVGSQQKEKTEKQILTLNYHMYNH